MLHFKKALAVAALAVTAASSAHAGLVGTTVDFNAFATGSTQMKAFGPGSATVGAGYEFAACVGPSGDNCSTSGLSVGIDISDASLLISFAGSTETGPGSFTLELSGFDELITSLALSSSRNLARGILGAYSHTDSTATFRFDTTTFYNGINQAFYVFDITTTAARLPEPASLALVGVALLGCGAAARRRRRD